MLLSNYGVLIGEAWTVPALLRALNASNDMPLCLGITLKPCCGGILMRIDPEAAAKAGVK